MILKYVQLNWMCNWFTYERISLTSIPLPPFFINPFLSFRGDCIFSPFSYLIPVSLNEVPWVALVWPDSCARGSLSKSSSKQRIRQRWGAAAAAWVQPCRAGPCRVLGAVVLFTVRLVPQDAVHLVCDGWWQLWKNLRQDRQREDDCFSHLDGSISEQYCKQKNYIRQQYAWCAWFNLCKKNVTVLKKPLLIYINFTHILLIWFTTFSRVVKVFRCFFNNHKITILQYK